MDVFPVTDVLVVHDVVVDSLGSCNAERTNQISRSGTDQSQTEGDTTRRFLTKASSEQLQEVPPELTAERNTVKHVKQTTGGG